MRPHYIHFDSTVPYVPPVSTVAFIPQLTHHGVEQAAKAEKAAALTPVAQREAIAWKARSNDMKGIGRISAMRPWICQ